MPREAGVERNDVRVTHVVFDLQGGGMESLVAAMAARFAGTRVRMSVISLSGRVGRVGETVQPLLDQFYAFKPRPKLSMIAPLGLAQYIRRTRPDVVHLHTGSWYQGALAARLAAAPLVIYTEHGREHHDPWLLRWLDRRAARWTDVVVTVSERLREYMTAKLGVGPDRLCTIENGVDTMRFSPAAFPIELRHALKVPTNALVIGSVGRLTPVKAYARLVESFARVRAAWSANDSRPLYLLICGDGIERPSLMTLAERLGLSEVARFPGWVDDPVPFYGLLDVFAMTSTSEGFPVSLLEAMACGAAPVATAVGAIGDILGGELAEQLVPPGNPEALERTLIRTLASSEHHRRIATLARQRVVERFSLERLIAAYERLYRSGARPVRARRDPKSQVDPATLAQPGPPQRDRAMLTETWRRPHLRTQHAL